LGAFLVPCTLHMDIKYLGHSSFSIRTKNAKIVTDPFDPEYISLPFAKTEADIITISHDHKDHNHTENVKGDPLVLNWPGEFEKNQVRITGFATFHDKKEGEERGENVMYKFEADEISLLHCGDLGHVIDDALIEQIGVVDVIFIPVGGVYTIDPAEAVKVINKIEPSVVIPMHYGRDELKGEAGQAMQKLEVFLKEIGASDVQPVDKFTPKREEMDAENMKVVTLIG